MTALTCDSTLIDLKMGERTSDIANVTTNQLRERERERARAPSRKVSQEDSNCDLEEEDES